MRSLATINTFELNNCTALVYKTSPWLFHLIFEMELQCTLTNLRSFQLYLLEKKADLENSFSENWID